MTPFSPEHHALLAALTPRSLSAWWVVLQPLVLSWAQASAWRRGLVGEDRAEVFADAAVRIIERVQAGALDALGPAEAEQRVRGWTDDVARSHARRRARNQGRAAEVEVADLAVSAESARTTPAEGAWTATAHLAPVRRLVVLLDVDPASVGLAAIADAVAASGPASGRRWRGLTRDTPATRALLGPWTLLAADWRARRPGGRRAGGLRRELAWILRGPPGSTDPSAWAAHDEGRALNWLDQQRSRARAELRDQLSLRAERAAA